MAWPFIKPLFAQSAPKLLWVATGLILTLSQTAFPSIITNLRRTRGTEESKSAAVWAYYVDPAATEVTQALCPHGLSWSEYNQYTCRGSREQVSFRDFFGAFGDPDFGTEHLRLLEQKRRLENGISVSKLFSDDLKTEGMAADRALATGLFRFYGDAAKFNLEALKEIDRALAAHLKASGPLADLYRALIDKQPHPMRANHEGEESLRFFVRQFPRSFEKAVTLKGSNCAEEIPGKIETRQGGCWFAETDTVYGRVERGAHRYDTLNWTVEGGVAHCASVNQGGIWGWRPPTARELTALVEARVAPLFVRGPEINHYFVTISEQTLHKTRSKQEDLGGYRQSVGSEIALVGTMPGSNLDPQGRNPLPVFAEFEKFEQHHTIRDLSYSYAERQQVLVQLSTGRVKEVTSHAITAATGVETTETKRFNTSPKYNIPGQGEFGGPLLKGSVAHESGSRQTTKDATPQAMTFAISDLPEDLSVTEIGLICVHDSFAYGRKGDRK